MNALFLNYTYPFPNNGGTERSIYSISSFLSSRGYNIYIGYFEGGSGNSNYILDFVDLSNKKSNHLILAEFIRKYNIYVVINFKKTLNEKVLETILKSNCILITSLRYAPNDLEEKLKVIFQDNKSNKTFKTLLKQLIKPLYLYYSRKVLQKRLFKLFEASDKYILQSDYYIRPFLNLLKKEENNKVEIIPNMLSFNDTIIHDEILNKDKVVLIVARMEEKSKRIFYALRIWNLFQKKFKEFDWKLQIVGEGRDLKRYKQYILDNKIINVTFYGRQDPYLFYKKAQIFMMTSSAEGFPTTLIEAQQMGCVPIAFYSFASVSDIIVNGINGFIIRNNDLEAYVERLNFLISNKVECLKLAQNAVRMSSRFNPETVGKRWINVLNACMHVE